MPANKISEFAATPVKEVLRAQQQQLEKKAERIALAERKNKSKRKIK